MRAIDTNVLVRLLVRDAPRQLDVAETFIAKGAWVSQVVLMETLWVLDAVYERSAEQIGAAVERLLAHADLTLQPFLLRSRSRCKAPLEAKSLAQIHDRW
jgi:predicted nucleic-acid-binding protein